MKRFFKEKELSQGPPPEPVNKVAPKKLKPGMKRVMRCRMTTDAKGYSVVEDYSSYEEMTKEEIEQQKIIN